MARRKKRKTLRAAASRSRVRRDRNGKFVNKAGQNKSRGYNKANLRKGWSKAKKASSKNARAGRRSESRKSIKAKHGHNKYGSYARGVDMTRKSNKRSDRVVGNVAVALNPGAYAASKARGKVAGSRKGSTISKKRKAAIIGAGIGAAVAANVAIKDATTLAYSRSSSAKQMKGMNMGTPYISVAVAKNTIGTAKVARTMASRGGAMNLNGKTRKSFRGARGPGLYAGGALGSPLKKNKRNRIYSNGKPRNRQRGTTRVPGVLVGTIV